MQDGAATNAVTTRGNIMTTSNVDLCAFVLLHDAASPLNNCFDRRYLRADVDIAREPEFLRFGGEGRGHPALLAVQIKAGKRERIEHGTGRRYVEKFHVGTIRAWRRLPMAESPRAVRRELLNIFDGSKKIETVAATAIWSTPMA